MHTVCPRILDPIYIVTKYMECVKTSWTDSTWSSVIRSNPTREGFFVNLGSRDCTIFRDTICTAAPGDFSVILRYVQEVLSIFEQWVYHKNGTVRRLCYGFFYCDRDLDPGTGVLSTSNVYCAEKSEVADIYRTLCIMYISWYLYEAVTHKQVRTTCGLKSVIRSD